MKSGSVFCAAVSVSLLVLLAAGCQSSAQADRPSPQLAPWFNPDVFAGAVSPEGSHHELRFDMSYSSRSGDAIQVTRCQDMISLGDGDIAEREYERWDFLRADCEAAARFYRAPARSVSHWPPDFNLDLVKSFPATAVPDIGGQWMDGRTGNLGAFEPSLSLIEVTPVSVKVAMDNLIIRYVKVARGDFNRDGYEDLFVRMDWHIEGTFGGGFDWVVLTRISEQAAPMLLWRK